MTKKIVALIITVVVVLGLVVGIIWLFKSGTLSWSSSKTASTAQGVCGNDIISKYNEASLYVIRGDSLEGSRDIAGMQSIATTIKGTDGYKDDATCQTILFWVAVSDNNKADAKAAYDTLVSLHDRAIYADNNLESVAPLQQYQQTIEQMTPRDSSTRPSSGQ